MARRITQFYLPPTHEPYLPLLSSRKASPPFGWYSLCLPTKGWPGWVNLGGWSHTEINVPHWKMNPDTVTHHNTNRARRWLTSLIEADATTTTPDKQTNAKRHANLLSRRWPRRYQAARTRRLWAHWQQQSDGLVSTHALSQQTSVTFQLRYHLSPATSLIQIRWHIIDCHCRMHFCRYFVYK